MLDGLNTYHWAPPARSRAKRSIPRKADRHAVGQLVFGPGNGQCLGYASHLEYKVAICAIYRPDVVDVEEQLEGIRYFLPSLPVGKQNPLHFIDFRVTKRGGHRVGLIVKPSPHVTPEFRAEVRAVTAAAKGHLVDSVCLVTEENINRIELANAEFMHEVRFPDPKSDAILAGFLPTMMEACRISDIVRQTGLGDRGFAAVVRALIQQALQFDRRQRIIFDTIVWPAERGQVQ